ncbi:lamin-C-like [Condylostylus longicornis]|uniref:lamin-C-like n=1 Tax=Condylostylus longicornis TaxID=2530218 RepID=UPI00244E10AE|nr:lamin-C-like [Condylostylus longicornis]
MAARDKINSDLEHIGDESGEVIEKCPTDFVSPIRQSRMAEKIGLQNLNDRLASFIDCVRNLETENTRLLNEMNMMKENVALETSNIRSMYEYESSDARKLLDEIAKEKAKLEIDTKMLWEENDELKEKCLKLKKNINMVQNVAQTREMNFNDLQVKYNQVNTEGKKARDDANELELENNGLRKQLVELKKNLDSELLARVELENAVQSLREELSFKNQVHSQELNESRERGHCEISEIDRQLHEKYEAKLQKTLKELRDNYESQIHSNREEIVILYEEKFKNLEAAVKRNLVTANAAVEELRLAHARIETLNSRISELEEANLQLQKSNRDLEKMIDSNRAVSAETIASLKSDINQLHEEMGQQIKEYQELLDVKVLLDMEIAAYDQLLKGEEERLNLKN